jgi:hypothetical protein
MRFVLRVAAVVTLFIAVMAIACYAEDFSADMVTSSPQGSFQAKIFVSGEKSRMEMQGAITISRMDKKAIWMLMPREKMYLEQPFDPKRVMSMHGKVSGEVERIDEGSEMVDGRMTKKYRVTVVSQGARESVFQWIDESVSIPVKTAAVDGSWSSDLKNIKTGHQKRALFEIPEGYTELSTGMPDMAGFAEAMRKSKSD